MATTNTNLSDYDKQSVPNGKHYSFGIVVSEWNPNITENLLKGAKQALLDNGVKPENIIVKYLPGTFELPLGAQYLFEHSDVDGQIAILILFVME